MVSTTWAAKVYTNQAGYATDLPKIAVVDGSANLAGAGFSLKAAGTVVHTGTLSGAVSLTDWGSQPYFLADFSAFTTPGTYILEVSDNSAIATSYSFQIADNALTTLTLAKLMSYFENDRADRSDVWATDAAISKYGDYSGKTYNVRGGWFDAAGDIGKYLSHLSYANYLNPQQTPLTVWALAFVKERIPSLLTSSGLGNKAQAEALWGADFLLRMLDPDGYFYLTVFDGWTGYMADREIAAFTGSAGSKSSSYKAAFREGGGLSIAALARISKWGVAGDSLPAAYLAGAKRAYAHLKVNGPSYCDNQTENIIDDYAALLAASELYQATDEATYLTDARARATSLIARQDAKGYFYSDNAKARPFWHASDAGLPLVALARYLEVEPDPAMGAEVVAAMRKHLDYLVSITNSVANPFGYARQTFKSQSMIQDGFFIPHDNESNYWWQGENARLASLSTAAFYVGRMVYPTPAATLGIPDSLLRYGVRQLDWILGSNPYKMSFFHGLGQVNSPAYFNAADRATQLVGGISNGITGVQTNGKGITFQSGPSFGTEPWEAWRWEEQWLPHSTWFLLAIAAMNDESPIVPAGVKQTRVIAATSVAWKVVTQPGQLTIHLGSTPKATTPVRVTDVHGRILASGTLAAGQNSLHLPIAQDTRGVMLVRVGSESRQVAR